MSPLRAQLGDTRLLQPYLEFLHMDLAYNFHLVDATELDAPLQLQMETTATGNSRTLEFPKTSYYGTL